MPQKVPEFHDFLRALNREGVRYVVIGGLAMILQGASYVTFDFDFAVSVDRDNVGALVRALAPFRPYPPQFGSVDNFVWDERSIYGAVVELNSEAGDLDIFLIQPGVDSFAGLWDRAETRSVGGEAIRVASLEDLIAMKTEANRPKDIEHLRQLRALKELRGGGT